MVKLSSFTLMLNRQKFDKDVKELRERIEKSKEETIKRLLNADR